MSLAEKWKREGAHPPYKVGGVMILSWAISFSFFALIAAALGFAHAAATTGMVAKVCFVTFGLVSLARAQSGRARRVPVSLT
jgi:uncharacterized membrane protein YtjA (UPF0391 family)